MVLGIERFKEWFRGCVDHYAIIGGTASALLMAKVADSAVVWDDLQKFLASMQGEQVDTKGHIPKKGDVLGCLEKVICHLIRSVKEKVPVPRKFSVSALFAFC